MMQSLGRTPPPFHGAKVIRAGRLRMSRTWLCGEFRKVRAASAPRPRLFEQRGCAEQRTVRAEAPDELKADRQPVAIPSAGDAHRGVAGHVERQSVGIPGAAQRIDRLPVDLDNVEELMLDRKRRPRERWSDNDVGTLEPALHLPVQIGSQEDGAIQLLRGMTPG